MPGPQLPGSGAGIGDDPAGGQPVPAHNVLSAAPGGQSACGDELPAAPPQHLVYLACPGKRRVSRYEPSLAAARPAALDEGGL